MIPAVGRSVPAMTEGRDEDEWRKRLTAKFRSGSTVVLLDNLRRCLDSAVLSSALTCTIWEDRVLQFSELFRAPVRCVWIATANNPSLSNEMTRRTIRIRMDAKQDRPWLRSGFRHADLRAWTLQHRAEIVAAALTVIRAWLVAGKPPGDKTLGMFDDWAKVMGGILAVADVPDFLGNLTEFYDEAGSDDTALRAFIGAWWDEYQDSERKVSELFPLLGDSITLPLGDKSEQSQKVRLGKLLTDNRDRTFTIETRNGVRQLRVTRGQTHQRAALWRLCL
jgi:hypothetical protein